MSFGNGDAKEYLALVKVSGHPPTTADDWDYVRRYITLNDQVVSFVARWNHVAADFSVPNLEGGLTSLRRIELVATTARKAHRLATQFDTVLPAKAEVVFQAPPKKELAGSSADLKHVCEHLKRHLTRAELSRAATQLAVLQEKLAGKSGPITATKSWTP